MATEYQRTPNSFANISRLPEAVRIPQGDGVDPPFVANGPHANFKLNHSMFWIGDPKETLHFYVDLMGLRTIFAMNTGPFTVYYLGFPTTPEHQADLAKFAKDLLVPGGIPGTLGLLELAHFHGAEKRPHSATKSDEIRPATGFGHIGFTVPDVYATVERLRLEGVEVIKGAVPKVAGPNDKPLDGKWEEEELSVKREDLPPVFRNMLDHNAFVRDPVGVSRLSVHSSPVQFICFGLFNDRLDLLFCRMATWLNWFPKMRIDG